MRATSPGCSGPLYSAILVIRTLSGLSRCLLHSTHGIDPLSSRCTSAPRGITRTGTVELRTIFVEFEPRKTLATGPSRLDPTTSTSPSSHGSASSASSVTLRARDLLASWRFYETALAPLGFGLEFERGGLLAFGSGESGRLIIYASERPVAGVHVAFSAPSREAVNRFHAAALEAVGATTVRPGRGLSTTKATTAPMRSTPMATTSRPSTTPFPRDGSRGEQFAREAPCFSKAAANQERS
jgi:hypothetical protein